MSAATHTRRWRRTAQCAPRRRLPEWIGWLALLAFGLRALVPLGFEPATDSLAIQICPKGFPAGFFAHRGPRHGAPAGRTDTHCTFCSSTTPAPAYAFTGLTLRVSYARLPVEPEATSSFSAALAHTPQARAPPTAV